MRSLRQLFVVLVLGTLTTIAIACIFAAYSRVPMYAGTPGATLPRPRAGMFVQWNRPWSFHEISGIGFTDRWWSDMRFGGYPGDEQKGAAELTERYTAERRTSLSGPRHSHVEYSDRPPSWGTLAQVLPPPDGFIIGSDTAYGWPLRCMWHQIIGKLAGDLTVGYSTTGAVLRGGYLLRGVVDSVGHDYQAIPLRPIWTPLLINIAFYGAFWWLALFAVGHGRRFLRRRRGACPKCGYNLQRDFAHGCPECGWNRNS